MSQQGPMMQPQQKSGVPGWLMGCGIGCGILAIIAVVVVALLGGLGYFVYKENIEEFKKGMEEAKGEMRDDLQTKFDAYVEKDVIPEEHRPLYDDLKNLAMRENASISAVTLCVAAIQSTAEDGEITDADVKTATEIRDFVKEDPEVGVWGALVFLGEHPEIQEAFNEAQQEFGVPSEPGAMDDEGMEEPPAPEVTPEEMPTEPAGAEQ